jgi:high affinity Mn2+ porin
MAVNGWSAERAGVLLGDGRLTYGAEQILEAYHRVQVGEFIQLTPDIQHIWNPGYSRDRGPATVYALRINARY